MATLTKGASVLTLPDNGLWPDEFDWRPVVERVEFTAAGAQARDLGTKLAGRPISLQLFVPRSTVATLYTWAADKLAQMTLAWAGQTFTVVFDHAKGAFVARPLYYTATYEATDRYRLDLYLKTVS